MLTQKDSSKNISYNIVVPLCYIQSGWHYNFPGSSGCSHKSSFFENRLKDLELKHFIAIFILKINKMIVTITSGFCGYCVKSNPAERDYKSNFLDNSVDIIQVRLFSQFSCTSVQLGLCRAKLEIVFCFQFLVIGRMCQLYLMQVRVLAT